MDIQQMLQQTNAIGAISRELGVDPGTAQAGAAALLPSILSGFKQPASPAEQQMAAAGGPAAEAGGFGGVLESIRGLGGGNLLDNVTSSAPTDVNKGNQILGQIFGSKDESRAVAARAAEQSGVEPSLLKKMLPMLAMVAGGYVVKQATQGGGGLGGALGGIFGGQGSSTAAPDAQAAPSQSGDILGQLVGAAGKFLGR
jgi:hypothetical protein